MERLDFFPPDLLNIFEDLVIKGDAITLPITDDTDTILRPFPNEHACRLNDPKKYDDFRRGKRKHKGKTYSIIFGKLKNEDSWEEQAYRYKKSKWDADDAKAHCKSHGGSFEAAKGEMSIMVDGTVLIHEGDGIWKEMPEKISDIERIEMKLDDTIEAIETLTEKINPPSASGSNNPDVDEKLYDGGILDGFNMKPNI